MDELDRSFFLALSTPLLSDASLLPICDIVKKQKEAILILRIKGQIFIFGCWRLKERSSVNLVSKLLVGIKYKDQKHLALAKCNKRCRQLFLRYCSKRKSEFISIGSMKNWSWTANRLYDLVQDEESNFSSAFYR